MSILNRERKMKTNRTMQTLLLSSLFVLAACVTININFPAAQATDIADKIVKDIYQGKDEGTSTPDSSFLQQDKPMMIAVLDWLVMPAMADVNATSPDVRRIQAQLKQRNADLKSFYTSGAVGLLKNGLLTVKDKSAVGLKLRGKLKKLVKAENADRLALYKAIAAASGHPEWAGKMQSTFAKQWHKNAQAGWWVQDSAGNWKQK
jgi:uncharacterized protein